MKKCRKKENGHRNKKQISGAAAVVLSGVCLCAAWLATGTRGISDADRKVYEQAAAMQEQADRIGFADFRLADYPVAMYDGSWDYVFYKGIIRRRKPVLETFAGTAYPVADHFEGILPTVSQFDRLLSLAGGIEGMLTGSGYGTDEQVAVLWHETFHAYQMTHFAILGEKTDPGEMLQKEKDRDHTFENSDYGQRTDEEWIVKEADQNEIVRKWIQEEMNLLQKAVWQAVRLQQLSENPTKMAKEKERIKELLMQYRDSRRQRMDQFPAQAATAEIRCELTEGTARYVEARIYRMLAGTQAYRGRYLDTLGIYEGGREKYYRTGMAKCLLLDVLQPGWKSGFDFTVGLDELLENVLDAETDQTEAK